MTKIYEALEQADRDRVDSKKTSNSSLITDDLSKILALNIEEQNLTSIYQNIVSMLPDKKSLIIQFIGSLEGEGTSTVINEFGKYAASKLKKSVLLVDTQHKTPSLADYYKVKPISLDEDETKKNKLVKDSLCQISMSSLFIGKISMNGNLSRISSLFEELKQDFEMILICSPGAMDNQDDLMFSKLADGVILIIEAEKTRWQVVDIVKERIELQGGNILGVVLNKRRFHIPKSIYKRI